MSTSVMRSRPAALSAHAHELESRDVCAARRHSLRIYAVKQVLIGLTVVAVVLVAADARRGLKRIEEFEPKAQVEIAGTKVVLQSPAIWGVLKDGSKFEIKADFAQEDIGNDNFIELYQVHAQVAKAGNSTVHASGSYGLFDQRKGTVSLDGDVTVENAEGNILTFKSVTLDVDNGAINALDLGPTGGNDLRSAAMMALFKQR